MTEDEEWTHYGYSSVENHRTVGTISMTKQNMQGSNIMHLLKTGITTSQKLKQSLPSLSTAIHAFGASLKRPTVAITQNTTKWFYNKTKWSWDTPYASYVVPSISSLTITAGYEEVKNMDSFVDDFNRLLVQRRIRTST